MPVGSKKLPSWKKDSWQFVLSAICLVFRNKTLGLRRRTQGFTEKRAILIFPPVLKLRN